MAFEFDVKKAFTDSSFYVINGTSSWHFIHKVFFFWNFCGCLFMLMKLK